MNTERENERKNREKEGGERNVFESCFEVSY